MALVVGVTEQVAAWDPDKTVAEQLFALGADRVETQSHEQVASLLSVREPAELVLKRTDGGYDLICHKAACQFYLRSAIWR